MNLRDLKYLVALAEHEHFGKAAKACFISQPALSMQIKKLEDYLGLQLIERTNKSFMFTAIGKDVCARAQNILQESEQIHKIAKTAKDPLSGEFTLGILPTIAPYLLPLVMNDIHKSFPKIHLALIEAQTESLLMQLKQGKIDAALLALPIQDPALTSLILYKEEFLLAIPKNHFLSNRKLVKPADLKDLSLLLLEDGHCLRDQALEVCHQGFAKEAQTFRATSLETLRHLVSAGLGITLLPQLACKNDRSVTYIPFNNPKPSRTIGLVWRTSNARHTLLKNFGRCITNRITLN